MASPHSPPWAAVVVADGGPVAVATVATHGHGGVRDVVHQRVFSRGTTSRGAEPTDVGGRTSLALLHPPPRTSAAAADGGPAAGAAVAAHAPGGGRDAVPVLAWLRACGAGAATRDQP